MICDYGCGNEAENYFPTVNKWCCSKHPSKCPKKIELFSGKNNPMYTREPWNKGKTGIYTEETLQKIRKPRNTKGKKYEEIYGVEKATVLKELRRKQFSEFRSGKEPWNKGKTGIYTEETLQKIRDTHTYNLDDYKIKYPRFYELENPLFENNKILVKCKFCKKLFNPTRIQLTERLRSIRIGVNKSFFYCSDKCKNECSEFNRKVDPKQLEEYIEYSNTVWRYTNKTIKEKKIKNINQRGRNKYHLDHKFSIYKGFEQNIDPFLIANYKNLEMLPEADNIRKGTQCSITLQELYSFQ